MPKKFYTERDIEDMFRSGIMSLDVGDSDVLTELAYEKARLVGMKLVCDKPDNPPSAPVRPYISKKQCLCSSPPPAAAANQPVLSPDGGPPPTPETPSGSAGPPFGAAPRLSTNSRPVVIIRIWVRLVTDCLANSKWPYRQQKQSALLLGVNTIKLHQSKLCFDT